MKLTEEQKAFWSAVFVAAVRRGETIAEASELADAAHAERIASFELLEEDEVNARIAAAAADGARERLAPAGYEPSSSETTTMGAGLEAQAQQAAELLR